MINEPRSTRIGRSMSDWRTISSGRRPRRDDMPKFEVRQLLEEAQELYRAILARPGLVDMPRGLARQRLR